MRTATRACTRRTVATHRAGVSRHYRLVHGRSVALVTRATHQLRRPRAPHQRRVQSRRQHWRHRSRTNGWTRAPSQTGPSLPPPLPLQRHVDTWPPERHTPFAPACMRDDSCTMTVARVYVRTVRVMKRTKTRRGYRHNERQPQHGVCVREQCEPPDRYGQEPGPQPLA